MWKIVARAKIVSMMPRQNWTLTIVVAPRSDRSRRVARTFNDCGLKIVISH